MPMAASSQESRLVDAKGSLGETIQITLPPLLTLGDAAARRAEERMSTIL
jgi:hypothetical protein